MGLSIPHTKNYLEPLVLRGPFKGAVIESCNAQRSEGLTWILYKTL